MFKKISFLLLVMLLGTGSISLLFGWGFWAHQRISQAAVFTLPDSMRTFFYNHMDFIREEAVMPDVRIYAIDYKQEINRHFIDLERVPPADTMPATLAAAVKQFGATRVDSAGVLPWQIAEIMIRLTTAFREHNKPYILFHAGDLAHYLADAHVPLHTSENYDGQLTGQKGIHAFWESQLPEALGSRYNFHARAAQYIADPKAAVWAIINRSHLMVDTLLKAEKQVSASFPEGDVFQKDASGNLIKSRYGQKKHTLAYIAAYNKALNGMIERQLYASISVVGDFWYTAWVNAGSPDLTALDTPALTDRNRKTFKKDLKAWKKGQLFGLRSTKEF